MIQTKQGSPAHQRMSGEKRLRNQIAASTSDVPQRDRRAMFYHQELRLIRLKEVLAICGKSRSSVYEAINKGEFPAPVKLRGRSSAWIWSEVIQWAEDCIRTSRA
ncbi:AlpA family transcriptional regulator [Duganella sp. HH101]|uniref:helix-turn-helix transcriptional regulator n=1 Tax=Duganella sp. HH101 TaxID=1781066 RepID=UPI001E57B928|nr:AlpA family transcriptional regulator [Duganella sp. HH101]